MLLAGPCPHAHANLATSSSGHNPADCRPGRSFPHSNLRFQRQGRRAGLLPCALVSTRDSVTERFPALEQLYSDILKEKRRRLESNFDASPDFDEVASSRLDSREDFERQRMSQSASTSDSEQPTTGQARRQRSLRSPSAGTSRRRSQRLAGRSLASHRPLSSTRLVSYDASLSQTAEAHDFEVLRRLLQVEDRLRSGSDMGQEADYYGIDLRPASVLPREVEFELTTMIRKALLADLSAEELQKKLGRPPSSAELISKLGLQSEGHLSLLQNNKRAAHMLMLRHNSRLVVHVAQKYVHWGVDMVDLVTEGMVGLERAIEKFEPEKGYKFSTYAFWWIRQKVPIPIAIFDTANKIKRIKRELELTSDEPVTEEQLAEAVGISKSRVTRSLQAARFEHSFDEARQASNEDMSSAAIDVENMLAPSEEEGGEAAEQSGSLQRQLDQLLNSLPPRDRNIIRMHYGLHDPRGEGMQLRDISSAYGVCHERVRKIEADAVQRLSRHADRAGVALPFMQAKS